MNLLWAKKQFWTSKFFEVPIFLMEGFGDHWKLLKQEPEKNNGFFDAMILLKTFSAAILSLII